MVGRRRMEFPRKILLLAKQQHQRCIIQRRQWWCPRTSFRSWSSVSSASVSSTGDDNDNESILMEGGIVEGVWIFTRHGDRSPGRCLSPAHRRNEEASFWVSKLPYPDSTAAYEAYSKFYPLQVLSTNTNQGQFLDTKRNPFGFLSQTGLRQLKQSGHGYFHRYNRHAHHMPDQGRWELAGDFLAAWNVRAYSTNYLRTVLSAQSFLDGLLGTHCFSPSEDRVRDIEVREERDLPDHGSYRDGAHRRRQQQQQQQQPQQRRHGHTTSNHDEKNNGDDDVIVPVTVRELSRDPLNAFDRNPDMIAELVSEVMTSKSFQDRDAAAAALAGRLANILPGLIRPRRSDFSSLSPSGINWVEAADHFVCREAHGLPLSSFTDFEGDDRIEQTLRAMSYPTKTHLSWRFRQWYRNRRLLSAIAGPPFREILNQMQETIRLRDDEKRPFTLYACHDITILGLLYGVGASFLANDRGMGWMWWPPYASTLAFELVRTDTDQFRVRILMDAKLIHSVDFADPTYPTLSTTDDGLLCITDFERLVDKLEIDGGSAARL